MVIRNFIKRLFIFLLPVCICLSTLEYVLYKIPNGYNTKRRLIEAKPDSIRVLILGSSHTLRGVNPRYFSRKAFNMAYVSQSLYYDAALTKKYFPAFTHLQVAIIPISYFTYDYDLMDSPEHWRDYFYDRYFGFHYPEIPITDIHLYSSISLYAAPSLYTWFKENYKINYIHEMDPNGWTYTDTTKTELSDAFGRLRVYKHSQTMHAKRHKSNIQTLCRLIEMLQARHVQVYLISTPHHAFYIKNTDATTLQKVITTTDSISHAYHIPYLNYFTNAYFADTDFINCDHLNARGAKKFSLILNDTLFGKHCIFKR